MPFMNMYRLTYAPTLPELPMTKLEPDILRRGREFHRCVQEEWSGEIEGAHVYPEQRVSLVRCARKRSGRIDLFVDKLDYFVSVIEIKGTDWDRVRYPRKLMQAHCRQILAYIDKYLDDDHLNVCAAVVYPRSPVTAGLKAELEEFMNNNALQIAWYHDR